MRPAGTFSRWADSRVLYATPSPMAPRRSTRTTLTASPAWRARRRVWAAAMVPLKPPADDDDGRRVIRLPSPTSLGDSGRGRNWRMSRSGGEYTCTVTSNSPVGDELRMVCTPASCPARTSPQRTGVSYCRST